MTMFTTIGPAPAPYVAVLPTMSYLGAGIANSSWPTNNEARYVPFEVSTPFTVTKIVFRFGTVAAGNYDVGLYTASGSRIVSLGSTAIPGAAAVVEADITDTTLSPGGYYVALVVSTTSASVGGMNPGLGTAFQQMFGFLVEASALPLPATATFAANAGGMCPFVTLKTF